MKTFYLAVYNPETKEIAHKREVDDEALLSSEVEDTITIEIDPATGEEKEISHQDKTALLLPYERNRY